VRRCPVHSPRPYPASHCPRITAAHGHALRSTAGAVNKHLVLRNWLMGAYLIEFEQRGTDRAAYGAGLLKRLASDLKARGVPGS